MKAKVDQLNLVFVILMLVLVAGKLYVWVCVCVSFNSVCFYSVTSRCWKHVQDFVVSDVGMWEKPAFEGALPWGMIFALRWRRHPVTGGLSPLLEKPDIYNGLYLLGKKADSFIEQNLLAGLPLVRWFLWGNVYTLWFLESQKMGSDFIASILIKCHKIRAIERLLQVRFLFPKSFKWSQWFPVLSIWPQSRWNNTGKVFQAWWQCTNPSEGISSTDIVWQEVQCKGTIFFKEAFKLCDIVGVENISCLILRFHKAEFARWDFSFARM